MNMQTPESDLAALTESFLSREVAVLRVSSREEGRLCSQFNFGLAVDVGWEVPSPPKGRKVSSMAGDSGSSSDRNIPIPEFVVENLWRKGCRLGPKESILWSEQVVTEESSSTEEQRLE